MASWLVHVHVTDWSRSCEALPYNTVDCDNANGNPKLCTIESDEPERVWVIIGSAAGGLHCDKTGCTGTDGYWTGIKKVFTKGVRAGWSLNWRDAKQYGPNDNPDYDIPNGMHCCMPSIRRPSILRLGNWRGTHR